MFTGIVEIAGRVEGVRPAGAGTRLQVRLEGMEGIRLGESIAVNGVCLTVDRHADSISGFLVTGETLERTNLGTLAVGDPVNLERSLSFGDRIGGHLVTGHVDGTGTITRMTPTLGDSHLTVRVPSALSWALVAKGSIAVDGISLTIVDPTDTEFSVALVQHTLDRTNLGTRRPGDRVNLEGDVMGRWVSHLLELGHDKRSLDWDRIRELGQFGSSTS